MASTIDKVKHALHLDGSKHTDSTTTTGHNTTGEVPTGTAGHHSSRAANAADPRIDSDLSNTHHHGTPGLGSNTHSTGVAGTGVGHSTHGVGTTTHSNTATNGPHDSSVLNKVDPRVDSDRDGSRNLGAATGQTGASAYTNSGVTGSSHQTGAGYGTGVGHTGSINTHAHSSGVANTLDPTVNTGSGYSGTHTGNHAGTNTGFQAGQSHSTNAGPHDSNLLNKADPRVDSDLDGRGNRHGASTGGVFGALGSHATAGSGTAQNTSGPHNSDIANKLDPRVDSDRDGSKTFGGNKTHA